MSIFGDRLKELRTEHNYSLRQLSALTQISASALHFYENGERNPKREAVEAVADVFNVDVEYLLGDTEIRNYYANSYGVNSLAEHYAQGKVSRFFPDHRHDVVFVGGSPYINSSPTEPQLSEGEKMWLELYHLLSEDSRAMLTNTMATLKALPPEKQETAALSFLHLLSTLQ